MMFRNDKQRKAMFASMNGSSSTNRFNVFSEDSVASKFRFKRGYEANIPEEELQKIVDKDIDISTLPKGTVKYYPLKDFGVQGAIDRAKDDSIAYVGEDFTARNDPVFDDGVVVGQALVVSEDHRRIDVAPKRARISDYDFISDKQEYDDMSCLIEAASDAVSVNDAIYSMYLDMGGESLDRDGFLESYRGFNKPGIMPQYTVEKIIDRVG